MSKLLVDPDSGKKLCLTCVKRRTRVEHNLINENPKHRYFTEKNGDVSEWREIR